VSWTVSGGLVGALVVSGHIMAGSVSSSVGFLTATVAFAAGSVVGYLHGSALGYLGRGPWVTRLGGLTRVAYGGVVAVPALVVGWLVAMVLALSAAAYLSGRWVTFGATLPGWVATLGFFAWAGAEGQRAWLRARDRWPEVRIVAAAIGLAALVLLPVFLLVRPEIWVLEVEPTSTAAVAMALVAAVWIVGPVAVLLALGVGVGRVRSATPVGGSRHA
jgi:hypothetical protein